MNHETNIGTFIRERRGTLGMDQKELGERCMLSQAQISRIENGVSFPSLPSIVKLARGLQMSVSELMEAAEPKTQQKVG